MFLCLVLLPSYLVQFLTGKAGHKLLKLVNMEGQVFSVVAFANRYLGPRNHSTIDKSGGLTCLTIWIRSFLCHRFILDIKGYKVHASVLSELFAAPSNWNAGSCFGLLVDADLATCAPFFSVTDSLPAMIKYRGWGKDFKTLTSALENILNYCRL